MAEKITARTMKDAAREATQPGGKGLYVWDTEQPGFGLYASPKGRISWFVERWSPAERKTKRLVFGKHPAISLEDARQQAGSLIGDTYKGIDLLDRKRRALEAKRQLLDAPSLEKAVELYLSIHTKPGSYWVEVKRKLEVDVIPELGRDTRVNEITKADIKRLIRTKQDKGHHGASRYLFAVLRPFMKWCLERDYIPTNPIASVSAPKPAAKRERKLSETEVKAFWKATETMGYPWKPYFRLLLLTAQRREEVAAMEWGEIHDGVWTIPASKTINGALIETKNKKEHLVHLSPQSLEIINGVKKLENTSLLFTTTMKTPISGYGKAKERLDTGMAEALGESLQLQPWRTHDLRRTAASGMAKIGIEPHVIELVLNHIPGGLKAVYQQHKYLPERKEALARWGAYIQKLTSA